MEINFSWKPEYIIGLDEIDSQHKHFLSIIERLYKHKDDQLCHPEVEKLIDELNKYVKFHFSSEEALMEAYQFPKIDKQKQYHQEITSTLKQQLQDIKEEKGKIKDLLSYLFKWFINHTTFEDKDIADFINKKRQE